MNLRLCICFWAEWFLYWFQFFCCFWVDFVWFLTLTKISQMTKNFFKIFRSFQRIISHLEPFPNHLPHLRFLDEFPVFLSWTFSFYKGDSIWHFSSKDQHTFFKILISRIWTSLAFSVMCHTCACFFEHSVFFRSHEFAYKKIRYVSVQKKKKT